MKIHIRRNKKSVAWISLVPVKWNGHLEIEYLRVQKEYRGNGFATKLILKAKEEAKDTVLVGLIDPHPDSSMTYEQEREWLIRLGFIEKVKYDFGDCKKRVMLFNPNNLPI